MFLDGASRLASTAVEQDCNNWIEDRGDPHGLKDTVVDVETDDGFLEAVKGLEGLAGGGCRLARGFLGS